MTWDEIAERAEKATGPDRELDAAVALAAGEPQAFFGPAFGTDYVSGPDCYNDAGTWGGTGKIYEAPTVTSSVDAMLALIAEKLPGILDVQFSYEPNDAGVWPAATIRWYHGGRSGKDWWAQVAGARTIPLALLATFAKAMAMAAQETRQEIQGVAA